MATTTRLKLRFHPYGMSRFPRTDSRIRPLRADSRRPTSNRKNVVLNRRNVRRTGQCSLYRQENCDCCNDSRYYCPHQAAHTYPLSPDTLEQTEHAPS